MSAILNLIKFLPEIIALLSSLQKAIDEAETERKVRDDINTIKEAFDSKDPDKLKHLFASK